MSTHRSHTLGIGVSPDPPQWSRPLTPEEEELKRNAELHGEPDPYERQWIPIGPRHHVPAKFKAWLSGSDPRYPRCDLEITHVGGRFACTRIVIWPDRDTDALPPSLRSLPINKFVREAVALCASEIENAEWRLLETDRQTILREGRGNAIPREDVVAVYTNAFRMGLPPRKAVEQQFADRPADTIKRWIQVCRKEGLLPATTPRRARA